MYLFIIETNKTDYEYALELHVNCITGFVLGKEE